MSLWLSNVQLSAWPMGEPQQHRSCLAQSSSIPACCSLPCLTQFFIQIWPQAQALAYFRYTSFCGRKKSPTQVTLKTGGLLWGQMRTGQECGVGGCRKALGTGTVLIGMAFLCCFKRNQFTCAGLPVALPPPPRAWG